MPLVNSEARYTYADYLSWPEDERIELINGVPYYTYGGAVIEGSPSMLAAPNRLHQDVSGELFGQLRDFLKGKPCKVYAAPFSVWLNADNAGDDTVVEPDVVVVCDKSKLDDRGCKGAPDLVIEILSPGTARKDRIIKFQQYQRAGVQEYWIVDPDTQSIQACTLNKNGNYVTIVYADLDAVPVSTLPGCIINLQEVFSQL